MKTCLVALTTLIAFISIPLLGQSRYVLDSSGKTVGQLIGNETRPALIRYHLLTGDTVLLEAFPYGLRQAVPFTSPVYFTSSTNCSAGVAYVDPLLTAQLTRRHAVTVNTFSATSPITLTSSLLYVSAPFPSVTQMPSGTVTTSRYQNGLCQSVTFPIGGYFLLQVNLTQNLFTQFTPPFWTP